MAISFQFSLAYLSIESYKNWIIIIHNFKLKIVEFSWIVKSKLRPLWMAIWHEVYEPAQSTIFFGPTRARAQHKGVRLGLPRARRRAGVGLRSKPIMSAQASTKTVGPMRPAG
jgi:hypothetical protein